MSALDSARLTALSEWIDEAPANVNRDPEARTWGRLAKVAEESGEVISAFIGATGQNPRKGVICTIADVGDELLDVAITALVAYEHLTRNRGQSIAALSAKLGDICRRAGIES